MRSKMLTQAADKGADRAYLALGKLYTSEKKTEDAKAAFQKYRKNIQKMRMRWNSWRPLLQMQGIMRMRQRIIKMPWKQPAEIR